MPFGGLGYVWCENGFLATHALKEVDGAAQAVAREPEQVVEILRYVIRCELA